MEAGQRWMEHPKSRKLPLDPMMLSIKDHRELGKADGSKLPAFQKGTEVWFSGMA